MDTLETVRPVRFLLIRGADKTVEDNKQETPLDLVNNGEITSPKLTSEVRKMLGGPKLCDCLMLSAPTRKVKRTYCTMIAYLIMMIIGIALAVLFTFPFISPEAILGEAVLSVLTLLFFLISSCMEPGYLKNDKVDFMDLLNVLESVHLCAECETIRTSRSRHCNVCGHCIERFDHHCPWINNCVGVRNHNAFYAYLIF